MADAAAWHYAGNAVVDGNNRVKIPDAVFDAGILAPGSEAYWAYEQVVGFLIVSNTELTEKPKYKPQASSVVGGEDDDYRATIPKIFFDDYAGMGSPVPEKARVTYGETRHYVYRSEMVERETKSCYLLTREQLENTIATPDDWAGSMDSIPRFMCEQ